MKWFIAAVCGLTATAFGPPQGEPEALGRLRACRAIAASEQRLACFDEAARALDEAIARRDVVVVDKQEVARTRRSLFGFDVPSLGILAGGPKEPPFVAIDSKIARVTPVGYGKFDMAIEGGAVWRNIELLQDPPAVGDSVHIDRTIMGGYFFKSRLARAVRAQRVR